MSSFGIAGNRGIEPRTPGFGDPTEPSSSPGEGTTHVVVWSGGVESNHRHAGHESAIELRPQCERMESNHRPRAHQTRAQTAAPRSRCALCGTRTHILWLREPVLIPLSYQSKVKRHGPPAWARAVMAVTTRVRALGPIGFMCGGWRPPRDAFSLQLSRSWSCAAPLNAEEPPCAMGGSIGR